MGLTASASGFPSLSGASIYFKFPFDLYEVIHAEEVFLSNLRQLRSDGFTLVAEEEITPEDTLTFKALLASLPEREVKLQIELRRIEEPFTGAFDGGILESALVSSAAEATVIRAGLVAGAYHWRARAVDTQGNSSAWQEFGTAGNADVIIGTLTPFSNPILASQTKGETSVPTSTEVLLGQTFIPASQGLLTQIDTKLFTGFASCVGGVEMGLWRLNSTSGDVSQGGVLLATSTNVIFPSPSPNLFSFTFAGIGVDNTHYYFWGIFARGGCQLAAVGTPTDSVAGAAWIMGLLPVTDPGFPTLSGASHYSKGPNLRNSVMDLYEVIHAEEPPPTISSISHTLGTQGETIANFAVDGGDFQPTSTLTFSGTGITVNSYVLRTATLIVASITIAKDTLAGPQNVIVGNGSQQSPPGGPFTVLQAPSGQIVLTSQDVPGNRSALLTPALPSTICKNTDGKWKQIKGHTGEANFTARVKTAKGKPAASVPVNFQVVGVNPAMATELTDDAGLAFFKFMGTNKGIDTITASAPVGKSTVVSDPAYVEWGQVTIAFKMPLPKDPTPRWRIRGRVNDPLDVFHQCDNYYSLDLADKTPGSEAPVLAPLGGMVTPELSNSSINSCEPATRGTFRVIDHESGFDTIYAHLRTRTVQIQNGNEVTTGQVVAALGDTGCSIGVHLHFQVRYRGTSARNDNLRILVEKRKIEEYCEAGKFDLNGLICTEGKYLSSNNGLAFGSIENPQPNGIVNSVVAVTGWALDDGSISTIMILINGSAVGTAVYGAARPDICKAAGAHFTWSDFLACPYVGFNGQLDTTTLTNGSHDLSVLAIDNDGAERVIGMIRIRVSNP